MSEEKKAEKTAVQSKKQGKGKQEVKTTGHSWDGIEELNNPLPKWWLYFFYATIIFGLIWTILYPAWPLVHGATRGVLGYNQRVDTDNDLAALKEQNAPLNTALEGASYEQIVDDPELASYAMQGGESVFETYCVQCHGTNGQGGPGYPNLLDDDWLWGGSFEAIDYTVRHGINDESDDETRFAQMPEFQGVFTNDELDYLVAYVQHWSEPGEDTHLAEGETLFNENCASCHMEDGKGNQELGAPNLTDGIWLYGGDEETIRETILLGRAGVMPQWGSKLSDAQIKQVVTYVHQNADGQ